MNNLSHATGVPCSKGLLRYTIICGVRFRGVAADVLIHVRRRFIVVSSRAASIDCMRNGTLMCRETRILSQPRANPIQYETVGINGANNLMVCVTHGDGAMIVARPARRAVAPTVPSLSYIAPANNGNAAANANRSALLLAIADAAIWRYAVTRYVNVDVKTKYIPEPKGTDAMIGAIQ